MNDSVNTDSGSFAGRTGQEVEVFSIEPEMKYFITLWIYVFFLLILRNT
jgi:hypothetical protein